MHHPKLLCHNLRHFIRSFPEVVAVSGGQQGCVACMLWRKGRPKRRLEPAQTSGLYLLLYV